MSLITFLLQTGSFLPYLDLNIIHAIALSAVRLVIYYLFLPSISYPELAMHVHVPFAHLQSFRNIICIALRTITLITTLIH